MAEDQALPLGRVREHLRSALRFMLAASVIVPLLFLAGGGWERRARMMEQAQADAARLSAIAHEHALKVLETNALVLDRLEDRIRGMGWAEIAARGEELHRWMQELDEEIAQIIALHIVEPNGDTALLSLAWPTPPLNLASRGYFRAMVAGERGILLGDPFISPLTGQRSAVFGRALVMEDGRFGGAVLGALLSGYFEARWEQMDPRGHASFGLVRWADGVTLASLPGRASAPGTVPDPGRAFGALPLPSDALHSTARFGERDEWLLTGSRLGSSPLGVTIMMDLDLVHAEWLRLMGSLALICLLAIAALGSASWMALRRWRAEQLALAGLEAEIYRREQAEAGMRQAQRLEAVGQLTGGVAHDFNNLLTAILGTVQLLDRHLGEAADARTRKLLDMARDAVRRGASLNQSLLAFARRQSLTPADLDANALLEGFAPLVQRAVGEAVTLELALAEDLPWCRVDASQLEAAILNLAINARDAMPRGGGCNWRPLPPGWMLRCWWATPMRARAPLWPSPCPTPAAACCLRCGSAPLSPSLVPSRLARARGLGSRRCSALSVSWVGMSRLKAAWGMAPASRCICRWRRRPRSPGLAKQWGRCMRRWRRGRGFCWWRMSRGCAR